MMRRLGVLFVCTAALALGAEAALGCSCAGGTDPREDLANADAAFYGEALSREVDGAATQGPGTATYRFRVERSYKGGLSGDIEVETSASGASCGLEVAVGERIGLLLRRDAGRWTSGLCGQRTREQLEAGLGGLPAPDGQPPARYVVGGRFGAPRSAALDAAARVIAYGEGDGDVRRIAPCPGGSAVLELVQRDSGEAFVAPRDVATFEAGTVMELGLERSRHSVFEEALDVVCLDAAGSRAAVLIRAGGGALRLVVLEDGARRTVWDGAGELAALTSRGLFADSPSGGGIRRVDLASGRVRRLARAPRGALPVALSPDGRRLLVQSVRRGRPRGVRILDASSGRTLATRATGLAFDALWVGDAAVALPGARLIVDRRLRRLGSLPRLYGTLAADGNRLVMAAGGKLSVLGRDGRRVGTRRELFTPGVVALAVLPARARTARASSCPAGWSGLRPATPV